MQPWLMLSVLHAKLQYERICLENANNTGQMYSQSANYQHYSLPLTCNLMQCMDTCIHGMRMYSMFPLTGPLNKGFAW